MSIKQAARLLKLFFCWQNINYYYFIQNCLAVTVLHVIIKNISLISKPCAEIGALHIYV